MRFSGALLGLSLALLGSAAHAHSDSPWAIYLAPERHVPVTIDGDLSEWADVPEVRIEDAMHLFMGSRHGLDGSKWSGPEDLSFTWRLMWDSEALYLAVSVTDDRPREPGNLRRDSLYENDTIEIITDALHDGRTSYYIGDLYHHEFHFEYSEKTFDPPRVNDNYWELVSPAGPDGAPVERLVGNGVEQTFGELYKGGYKFKRTDKGYDFELKFTLPGVILQRAAPGNSAPEHLNYRGAAPRKGVFGFEIAVADNDVDDSKRKGGDGLDHRDSMMYWTGEHAAYWRSAERLGDVYLVGPIR